MVLFVTGNSIFIKAFRSDPVEYSAPGKIMETFADAQPGLIKQDSYHPD